MQRVVVMLMYAYFMPICFLYCMRLFFFIRFCTRWEHACIDMTWHYINILVTTDVILSLREDVSDKMLSLCLSPSIHHSHRAFLHLKGAGMKAGLGACSKIDFRGFHIIATHQALRL